MKNGRTVVRNAMIVPGEAQVQAAIKRGDAAATEMEASLTELRELSDLLNIARDQTAGRLAQLVNQAPSAGQVGLPRR